MRLFYYVKATLKGMLAGIHIVCGYFIIFPILIACVLGFAGNFNKAELKVKQVGIKIENLDNSEASINLVDFLKENEVEKIVKIDNKSKNELIIPKGYGQAIKDSKNSDLVIKIGDPKAREGIEALKAIIERYNENLYLQRDGKDIKEINSIQNSNVVIPNEILAGESSQNQDFARSASVSISFVISLLIYTLIQSGNADIGINIYKRIKSFSIRKADIYVYDFVGQIIYVGIILVAYVGFFRLLGVAFKGNLLELAMLIVATTILSATIISCVTEIFSKKWAKAMGGIVFFLFCFGGELFPGIGKFIDSPTLLIEKTFLQYTVNGSLVGNGNIVAGMFIVSIILFTIGFIKSKYFKERAL